MYKHLKVDRYSERRIRSFLGSGKKLKAVLLMLQVVYECVTPYRRLRSDFELDVCFAASIKFLGCQSHAADARDVAGSHIATRLSDFQDDLELAPLAAPTSRGAHTS